MNKTAKISLGVFILSIILQALLYIPKITGFVIYAPDPDPQYGLILLLISIISAIIFIWSYKKKK